MPKKYAKRFKSLPFIYKVNNLNNNNKKEIKII